MEVCSQQEWDEVIALAKEKAEEGDVKAMASTVQNILNNAIIIHGGFPQST